MNFEIIEAVQGTDEKKVNWYDEDGRTSYTLSKTIFAKETFKNGRSYIYKYDKVPATSKKVFEGMLHTLDSLVNNESVHVQTT